MSFEGWSSRHSGRYLKTSISESIVHAIEHVSFPLCWTYIGRVITTELITRAFLYKSIEVDTYPSAYRIAV